MDGIELAARFSYITNSLRFCGPEEASQQFIGYIKNQASSESVRDSIKRFEGLYPYLSTIAQKTHRDFLDYEVVEAYWIGNELLEDFDNEDLKLIIEKLMGRGLPKSIGDELMAKLPNGMVPHHNFNVFYVGVGRTSGTVPTTLQNMDNCRTSWGRVIEIMDDKLVVASQVVKNEYGKFFLEDSTKTAVFLPQMLEPKKNDFVALHWGFACHVLNEKQLLNLEKYTEKILNAVNRSQSQSDFL